MRTIVLDTNCLLAALPSVSPYHKVWTDLLEGRICLCVSNDILEEYEGIIAKKTTSEIAKSVVRLILQIPNLKKVTPTYFLHLIDADPDDNKFVDCAFCGKAELIVTNDSHFNVLKKLPFPEFKVLTIRELIEVLP